MLLLVYKALPQIVDKLTANFIDHFVYTQCFPVRKWNEVEQLAGIFHEESMFHLQGSLQLPDLAIPKQP